MEIIKSDDFKRIEDITDVKGALGIVNRLKDIFSDGNSKHQDDDYWYRGDKQDGETGEGANLTPKIFREEYREPELMIDAQRWIVRSQGSRSRVSFLCEVQHLGVPTRVLDWSENVLVALYFAVSDKESEESKGTRWLYILKPKKLNGISGLGEGRGQMHVDSNYGARLRVLMSFSHTPKEWLESILRSWPEWNWERYNNLINEHYLKDTKKREEYLSHRENFFSLPLAIYVPWTNERMRSQSAVFTLHGGWKKPGPFSDDKSIIQKARIPSGSIVRIRKQLRLLNIHSATIFPESNQQGRYLAEKWKASTKSNETE